MDERDSSSVSAFLLVRNWAWERRNCKAELELSLLFPAEAVQEKAYNPVALNTRANSLWSVLEGNHSKQYFVKVEIRVYIVGYIISSQENTSKNFD